MVVYDLGHLPTAEQRRWRAQHFAPTCRHPGRRRPRPGRLAGLRPPAARRPHPHPSSAPSGLPEERGLTVPHKRPGNHPDPRPLGQRPAPRRTRAAARRQP
jgi:hypothetical protein